jgi:hypothetical protein
LASICLQIILLLRNDNSGADEQRQGGEHRCGDHKHKAPGSGNRPLAAGPVSTGAGFVHGENQRKRKGNGVSLGKENRLATRET